jgi:hypothetical protein
MRHEFPQDSGNSASTGEPAKANYLDDADDFNPARTAQALAAPIVGVRSSSTAFESDLVVGG